MVFPFERDVDLRNWLLTMHKLKKAKFQKKNIEKNLIPCRFLDNGKV